MNFLSSVVMLERSRRLPPQHWFLRLIEWQERRAEAHFLAPPFPYFPASPLRNSMLTSSSLVINAQSSLQSAAARVSVSCSTRLAPRMTEVMAGFVSPGLTKFRELHNDS